jgi:regulatory protein
MDEKYSLKGDEDLNEITSITPQVKDKRRCNIYIDGRFCCGLTLETAVKNRLKVGMVISPETLSAMQLESEKDTALDKALLHVSTTRKTEKQVRDFLTKKGYLADVIDYVLEKMRGYNFVNDGEYAEAYVESLSAKKGVRLMKMELKSKGVDDTQIDAAFLGMDETAQLDGASTLLGKYMRGKTADRETLVKAFRYLMGKGFEYDVAKAALTAFGELDED